MNTKISNALSTYTPVLTVYDIDGDYLHVIGYFPSYFHDVVHIPFLKIHRTYYLLFRWKISAWDVHTIRRWSKRSLEWKL